MDKQPEAFPTLAEDHDRIEFLKYLTDFLTQFTRRAEALSLKEIAYFLSMASLASHDLLAKLAEEDIQRAMNSLPLIA
jgi:hypothetical protein